MLLLLLFFLFLLLLFPFLLPFPSLSFLLVPQALGLDARLLGGGAGHDGEGGELILAALRLGGRSVNVCVSRV